MPLAELRYQGKANDQTSSFPWFHEAEASCEFVEAERLSRLSWWLVVTWKDCFVGLTGWLRCSTLLPLNTSWLSIWSAVTLVTTGGETLSAPIRRMHRCQPSRNRAGNPAFGLISRIFQRTSRISGFISKYQKSLKIALILAVRRHFVRKISA